MLFSHHNREEAKVQRLSLVLVFTVLSLIGCGSTGKDTKPPPQMPGIHKSDSGLPGGEAAVVNFHGRLMFIVTTRALDTNATGDTTVHMYEQGIFVGAVPAPRFAFISALISQGVLYVFGTVENRTVWMVSSPDLVSWTAPIQVFDATPDRVYNTSVTTAGAEFVMAYETDAGVPYTTKFAKSTDLVSWHSVGAPLHYLVYSGCPTIRYVNGVYYVFSLRTAGRYFYTSVDRSYDLTTWYPQTSRFAVLSPEQGEGVNTSDMDVVEYNGQTVMVYDAGDQATWSRSRIGTYDGSLATLLFDLFDGAQ